MARSCEDRGSRGSCSFEALIFGFGVVEGDGFSVGVWFCRWKLDFLMDIDWSIYLFIYLFLTAASAKAAEFYSCRSFKLRVSGNCLRGFLLVVLLIGIFFFGGGGFSVIVGVLYFNSCCSLHRRVYLAF